MSSIGNRPNLAAGPTVERRSTSRVGVMDSHLVPVEIGHPGIFGLLVDVSEAGLGIQTLDGLPLGRTFSLSFALPRSRQRVEADGRVTWVDRNGRAGICFSFIEQTSRHDLASWVHSTLQQAGVPAGDTQASATPADPVAALAEELATQPVDAAAGLQFVAERLLQLTRGTGVAIALQAGAEFICRASAGVAPEPGTAIQISSGLSTECVQTGRIVRCEDTERDERVDPEVARALSLRSAMIVPLKHGSAICGLLEVFSSQPYAFDGQALVTVRHAADLVARLAADGSATSLAPPLAEAADAPVAEPDLEDDAASNPGGHFSDSPPMPPGDPEMLTTDAGADTFAPYEVTEEEIVDRRREAIHLGSIVDPLAYDDPSQIPAPEPGSKPQASGGRHWFMVLAIIVVLLLVGLVAGWFGYRRSRGGGVRRMATLQVAAGQLATGLQL